MGFLNKLLNKGMKALEDAVVDAVVPSKNSNSSGATGTSYSTPSASGTSYSAPASSSHTTPRPSIKAIDRAPSVYEPFDDKRAFDVKFREAVASIAGVSIEENVSPETVESGLGKSVIVRKGTYSAPSKIAFAVNANGKTIYVRNFKKYSEYARTNNRILRSECEKNGIPMLDFFDYLPNNVGYIKNRITSKI